MELDKLDSLDGPSWGEAVFAEIFPVLLSALALTFGAADEDDSLDLIGCSDATNFEEIFVSGEGAVTGAAEACTDVKFSAVAAFVSLAATVEDDDGAGFAAGIISSKVRLSFPV